MVADEAVWEQVLVTGWGPLVRGAVVERVERATVGRRGLLVRTLTDPDNARYAWTEQLHQIVLDAIHAETGADLEELGSQAVWAVYDDTWSALAARWADGGALAVVPAEVESRVIELVRSLSPTVATCLGVDAGVVPYGALRVNGRVLLDVEGAYLAVAADVPGVDDDRQTLDELLALVG